MLWVYGRRHKWHTPCSSYMLVLVLMGILWPWKRQKVSYFHKLYVYRWLVKKHNRLSASFKAMPSPSGTPLCANPIVVSVSSGTGRAYTMLCQTDAIQWYFPCVVSWPLVKSECFPHHFYLGNQLLVYKQGYSWGAELKETRYSRFWTSGHPLAQPVPYCKKLQDLLTEWLNLWPPIYTVKWISSTVSIGKILKCIETPTGTLLSLVSLTKGRF